MVPLNMRPTINHMSFREHMPISCAINKEGASYSHQTTVVYAYTCFSHNLV